MKPCFTEFTRKKSGTTPKSAVLETKCSYSTCYDRQNDSGNRIENTVRSQMQPVINSLESNCLFTPELCYEVSTAICLLVDLNWQVSSSREATLRRNFYHLKHCIWDLCLWDQHHVRDANLFSNVVQASYNPSTLWTAQNATAQAVSRRPLIA
jgi:hypothetical protein